MLTHERYLGDGVYASFDGYHVWLDLRAQDSTTRIALEPAVLDALDQYRASLLENKMEVPMPDDLTLDRCRACGMGTLLIDGYCRHHRVTGPLVEMLTKQLPQAESYVRADGVTVLDLSRVERLRRDVMREPGE